MRDLILIMLFSGMTYIVWQQASTGILALAAVGYLHPQGYAFAGMQNFPAYSYFFLLTLLSFSRSKEWRSQLWLKQQLNWLYDWRIILLLLLWLQFIWSSSQSLMPEYAWARWTEVSKMFLGLLLTLLLIDQPKKLLMLIVTIALAISLVAFKGGYWALIYGANDRVYGPPNSHFHDNNSFAIAALMAVPLLFLWYSQINSKAHRLLILSLILFCIIASLSSWSRGALLSMTVTSLVLAWYSPHRLSGIAAIVFFALCAFFLMPDDWLTRMQTLQNYQSEDSAASRLAVWQIGITQGLKNPWHGWGFDSWTFVAIIRDWHSAYIEMFAEHGFIGLFLWLGLLLGSILRLGWISTQSRKKAEINWAGPYARMLQASLVAYGVGAFFLGISYWDFLFHLILLGVILDRLIKSSVKR